VLVASALVPSQAASDPSWATQIDQLLLQRARAVLSGDKAAFDATMRAAPASFRQTKDSWFDRIRVLPLRVYSLSRDTDGYLDLAAAMSARSIKETHVVSVIERIGFAIYDRTPSAENVYFTVQRSPSGWSIVADDSLDTLGVLSSRNLWDTGPVSLVRNDNVMVMYQRNAAAAERIASASTEAIAFDRRRWPFAWPARVIVMIPPTSRALARIFQTTFDLGPFVAFSSSSLDRTGARFHLTGHRVFVQPDTYFGTSPAYQRDTLSHELLHIATRDDAGEFTPSWLDEGVAQVYGQRSLGSFPQLAQRVRSGRFTGHLPPDWQFAIASDSDIHLAYEESADFIRYLRGRFGASAGARLYRELGRESPLSFGTGRYHLDRAARRAFKVGFDDLERGWARNVVKEFA
jgi:hypothetical protein